MEGFIFFNIFAVFLPQHVENTGISLLKALYMTNASVGPTLFGLHNRQKDEGYIFFVLYSSTNGYVKSFVFICDIFLIVHLALINSKASKDTFRL